MRMLFLGKQLERERMQARPAIRLDLNEHSMPPIDGGCPPHWLQRRPR